VSDLSASVVVNFTALSSRQLEEQWIIVCESRATLVSNMITSLWSCDRAVGSATACAWQISCCHCMTDCRLCESVREACFGADGQFDRADQFDHLWLTFRCLMSAPLPQPTVFLKITENLHF